ncbi:MAG: right-handed parallel beta-helix repeat-containing protein [Verrucomicrobiaceae bacterium]
MRNCIFTGNRTAIYLNGGNSDATITRNTIDDNRTGFLPPDGPTGAYVITENNITNNKTFGVLFDAATAIDPGFTLAQQHQRQLRRAGREQLRLHRQCICELVGQQQPRHHLLHHQWHLPGLPITPAPRCRRAHRIRMTSPAAAATAVDYTPLILSGVDSDSVTPGFQPDSTVLRVVSASPQATPPVAFRRASPPPPLAAS